MYLCNITDKLIYMIAFWCFRVICGDKSKYSEFVLSVSLCSVWFGVIFIRHGLYQDGVFKFTVYIPDNYPDGDCPVSSVPSLAICILTVYIKGETWQSFCCCYWWWKLHRIFIKTVLSFISEISIWHPSLPSPCGPCIWRAWRQKSLHQMEVCSVISCRSHPQTGFQSIKKSHWMLYMFCLFKWVVNSMQYSTTKWLASHFLRFIILLFSWPCLGQHHQICLIFLCW